MVGYSNHNRWYKKKKLSRAFKFSINRDFLSLLGSLKPKMKNRKNYK